MKHVVFVAPMFSPAASQMIEAAVSFAGRARVAVISQEAIGRLDPRIAGRLAGHITVADITDPQQLEQGIRHLGATVLQRRVDACFAAYEQAQLPLALARERLGIAGMSSRAAERFRDKAVMKDALRAAGIPVARHALLVTRQEAERFVNAVGFPIVVKPPAGAGARATFRIASLAELHTLFVHHHPSPERPLLAEEFLRGREHSLETVSVAGRAVWHSLTVYDPTPLDVMEHPWIQWTVLLPREVDAPAWRDIRDIGARALEVLGMETGVSHCEWFRRDDGSVAVSEIAARPPGAQITTMMSRATDTDFVRDWVALMMFGEFTPPERRYAVGTAYLRGQGTGRIAAVDGLAEVERQLGPLICDFRLPVAGQEPTGSYEGEGFIVLRHPETAVVERALRLVVDTVRVRLA
jgi:hypothetical protein